MRFKTKTGKKGRGDQILLVRTDGYEQMTYEDLFRMVVKHFYDNEDRVYPPPAKGSKYLLEALTYLRTHNVEETLIKSKLKTCPICGELLVPHSGILLCPECGHIED